MTRASRWDSANPRRVAHFIAAQNEEQFDMLLTRSRLSRAQDLVFLCKHLFLSGLVILVMCFTFAKLARAADETAGEGKGHFEFFDQFQNDAKNTSQNQMKKIV